MPKPITISASRLQPGDTISLPLFGKRRACTVEVVLSSRGLRTIRLNYQRSPGHPRAGFEVHTLEHVGPSDRYTLISLAE